MKNDGWTDINYSFGENEELNKEISNILNEVCHVFRHHADGNWKEHDKPKYAEMLIPYITKQPSLIKKLLKLNDPVISNVTYAAIDIEKEKNSAIKNT